MDLDQVLYNETVSYPHPWTRRIFQDCMRAGYECWVLEDLGIVAAHSVLSIAADESHLLTLCVNPDYRRRGLARRLLRHVLEQARQAGVRQCFLEVRPSNGDAQQLYYSEGFVRVGERRDYYPTRTPQERREDALILQLTLPEEAV
ncbi:MAG: ribosomal protein S18-alanine N-acetyltransferase [Pseudomonadota bacterium]